ncbi:MAG: hypothetical protein K8T26_07935 [Lentisphaerae bacterium]|nr:hypothetical protein [Lentisphaerota bacterium]
MGEEQGKGGGSGGGLRRGIVTLVIILVILWTTLYFALGTKGGHDFVQAQLSKRLGTEVTLERARLGLPAALQLTGVQSADYTAGELGFRVEDVRLAVGVHPWFRVKLVRPELNIVYDGSTWYPTNFAGLGELPERDLGALSDLCAPWRERVAVALEDGLLTWHRDAGAASAMARGVDFQIEPVSLPGHDGVYFHRLRAASVQELDGRQTDNVELEWLVAGSTRYIEMTRGATLPPAQAGFWGVGDDTANGY